MARRGADRVTGRPTVSVAFSDRSDGDFCIDAAPVALRRCRQRLAPGEWTWLRQVHGDRVVVVERPGDHAGAEADAAVTTVAGAVLAVNTADCAGVVFVGRGPAVTAIGAAHAGWRGLEVGVLQSTVESLCELGVSELRWRLGPCISDQHYEFGTEDLDRLAQRYGPSLRSTAASGAPALDLRAGVRSALAECGIDGVRLSEVDADRVRCTAADDRFYSWRRRGDTGRQVAAVWMGDDGWMGKDG